MSAAFTVPAAVRSPRTVAARRAWLVVLFLGGLLGLAVLFGGSAHAASGPETTGSAGTGKVLPSADEAKQRAGQRMEPGVSDAGGAGAVEGAGEADDARSRKAAEQAAEQTADRAADRTVRPAADGVERIARSAGEPVADLVGSTTGASQRLPDVGTGDGGREQRSRPDGQARPGAGTDREGQTPAAGARQPAGPAQPAAANVQSYNGDQTGQADPHEGQQRDDAPGQPPRAPHAITPPNAGDAGPRGGDTPAALRTDSAHAVTAVAGAVRAAAAEPTRERPHDILQFPG